MPVTSIDDFFKPAVKAEDCTYKNVRDLNTQPYPMAREKCLRLWEKFKPYADSKFLSQLQKHFGGGCWEMLLTKKILEQGLTISSKDDGPDICTTIQNKNVFIEAICTKRGEQHNQVNALPPSDKLQSLKEDPISLRLTSAFRTKNDAFKKYLNEGIVTLNDILIIAINAGDVPDGHIENSQCPRMVQLAYAIGDAIFIYNDESSEVVSSYQRREQMINAKGSPINTNLFLDTDNSHISAILYTSENIFNSKEYYLVLNPNAKVPLPAGSIHGVREFNLNTHEDILNWKDN
ncbi:hypothetical protein FM038_003405 [Shewanella eurypsychrophilus]|uniref:Uncharacterized protein n=1 Tax=Shewanella eurypsychrophilus TaxID=2593656 RepID=A0ABX6V224_9GAMM|nr:MULTISPECIES: hypothetical protein [Shewanella]QFU21286.1 hypothetical protein FS418_04985 [Shewanella sp. YLB-09]QPG56577.1 hypothetical protein FM038_003405 [Shewanella eurypsychrophilus]